MLNNIIYEILYIIYQLFVFQQIKFDQNAKNIHQNTARQRILSSHTDTELNRKTKKKREKLLANYQQENIRGGEFVFIQSITFSMKLKISYVIKHSLLNTSVYWVCRFDSLCCSKNDLMFLLSNFAIDRTVHYANEIRGKTDDENAEMKESVRFYYRNWSVNGNFCTHFGKCIQNGCY